MITIDTKNMCSYLQHKLFEEDDIYHSLWIAMQADVIFKRRSNEETKNQIFGNILPLLVCTFSLAGGRSSEVPDIG